MTALDRLRQLPGFRPCGEHQYEARCPGHEDKRASLSIGVADGKILLHCHAGCGVDRILHALGLATRDLFTNGSGNGHHPDRQIVATYDYRDEHGELIYQVVRMDPKDFRQRRPDGQGGWTWNARGIKRIPYRLPELLKAEYVFITEGEKDVENLRRIGLTATCIAGGANAAWGSDIVQYFRDSQHVTIIPDHDEPGEKYANNAAQALHGRVASIRILRLRGLPEHGDVSDWLVDRDPVAAAEELCKLSEAAEEWRPDTVGADTTEPAPAAEPPAEAPYQSPCPPDHYLSQWVAYAQARTDAAPEYHEAAALVLLAAATPGVRARLAPYPGGLPTNLYILMIGDSTTSRKSTSLGFGRDVQSVAMRDSLCADHFSPEGFIEFLAARGPNSTTLYVDEFAELLGKIHHAKHMAGLRGLLLTVYGGDSYTYRRHSKNNKGTRHEDIDHIERPHLSILGATTPTVFDTLDGSDLDNGLLPRFALVMPTRKTERRPFYATAPETESRRRDLIAWAARLHEWSRSDESRTVLFDAGVLECIDSYAIEIESACSGPTMTPRERLMLQRLLPMTVKVAMLIAAGHPGVPDGPTTLHVSMADAEAAVTIARRWQRDAIRFAGHIGESQFERTLQRCLAIVQGRRIVQRGVIARNAHVDAKTLDNIRDTLIDRELIEVSRPQTGGRSGEIWLMR